MSWWRESSAYRVIVEEGRVTEARRLIIALGTERLGPPSVTDVRMIEAIDDVDALERLARRVLTASTWQELLASASGG